jgi:HAD superfamily hydrolase (TIGR01509 family)
VITAVIFDLDGTLVQTETLKAQSYAHAAIALRPDVAADAVIQAYDHCIGRPRDEVAQILLDQFGLTDAAAARAASLGVATPRDAFLAIRMHDYETMLADPALLRRQEYPYATALLRRVRAAGYATALTTVSHAAQAFVVLDALDLRREFDVIVTVDDVAHGKPDPELYVTAATRLHQSPNACLAIEDSLPGVQAAVAAGMQCVAIANELTRDALHAASPLPGEQIVDDPRRLDAVVDAVLTSGKEATACN